MTRTWLLLCFLLPACALFRPPARPVHAPPEESAQVTFPRDLPAEGLHELSGITAAAIALAMEDFRPLGATPHRGATPLEQCLYRRESFDVSAAPARDSVVFVRFSFNPDACAEHESGVVLDAGASYAVDVKQWRILAIQR